MERPYKIDFSVTYADLSTAAFSFYYPTEEIRDEQYEAIRETCEKGYDHNRILHWIITRSN